MSIFLIALAFSLQIFDITGAGVEADLFHFAPNFFCCPGRSCRGLLPKKNPLKLLVSLRRALQWAAP